MPRERAGIWVGPEPAIAEFFYACGQGREGGDVDENVAAGEKFLGDGEKDVGLAEFAIGEEEVFWVRERPFLTTVQIKEYILYVTGSQTC
jgi:hypothetical protein